MPGTDYDEVFDENGNLISSTPREVSDDELLLRQLGDECNSYHSLAIQAYNNYDSLTPPQKDKILKFLLGFYLTAGERLGYFVV